MEHLSLQVISQDLFNGEEVELGAFLQPLEAQSVHGFLTGHEVLNLRESEDGLKIARHFVQSEILLRSVGAKCLCHFPLPYNGLPDVEAVLATDGSHQHIIHVLIEGKPVANETISALLI